MPKVSNIRKISNKRQFLYQQLRSNLFIAHHRWLGVRARRQLTNAAVDERGVRPAAAVAVHLNIRRDKPSERRDVTVTGIDI